VRWLWLAPWPLLLLFMAKVGTYQNARQLAPYYVFFFPCLLAGAEHALLVRRRWWQRFGLAVMLSAVALLVLARDRPVLPAKAIAYRLQVFWPHSRFLALVKDAYSMRSEAEAKFIRRPLGEDLPPHEAVIGYATFRGTGEPGLWAPFGIRKVERVLQGDTPEQLRARGIHYMVMEQDYCDFEGRTLEQRLAEFGAELVKEVAYVPGPNSPPYHVYLLRLKSGVGAG
jgi:hypothetical protein